MKQRLGNLAIVILVVLTVLVWIVFPPVNNGSENFMRAYVGEVLGSTLIVLMSCSLFLSTRAKWAEPFFGGLDKMYLTHQRTSTSAFLLMFVHRRLAAVSRCPCRLRAGDSIIRHVTRRTLLHPI